MAEPEFFPPSYPMHSQPFNVISKLTYALGLNHGRPVVPPVAHEGQLGHLCRRRHVHAAGVEDESLRAAVGDGGEVVQGAVGVGQAVAVRALGGRDGRPVVGARPVVGGEPARTGAFDGCGFTE